MAYPAGEHALLEDMLEVRRLLLLVCSTFIVDASSGHFLFLNVVFVFNWLTCLISVIGLPPVLFCCLSGRVVVIM